MHKYRHEERKGPSCCCSIHFICCLAVQCGPLPNPENGKILGYKFYFPHSVRYMCDQGFRLTSGDIDRNCTSTGQWSGIAPVCQSNLIILIRSLQIHHQFSSESGVCLVSNPNCSEYEVCVVEFDGRPKCVCQSTTECSLDNNPVCGSNGVTYTNECFLKVHICQLDNGNLRKLSDGACGETLT